MPSYGVTLREYIVMSLLRLLLLRNCSCVSIVRYFGVRYPFYLSLRGVETNSMLIAEMGCAVEWLSESAKLNILCCLALHSFDMIVLFSCCCDSFPRSTESRAGRFFDPDSRDLSRAFIII